MPLSVAGPATVRRSAPVLARRPRPDRTGADQGPWRQHVPAGGHRPDRRHTRPDRRGPPAPHPGPWPRAHADPHPDHPAGGPARLQLDRDHDTVERELVADFDPAEWRRCVTHHRGGAGRQRGRQSKRRRRRGVQALRRNAARHREQHRRRRHDQGRYRRYRIHGALYRHGCPGDGRDRP